MKKVSEGRWESTLDGIEFTIWYEAPEGARSALSGGGSYWAASSEGWQAGPFPYRAAAEQACVDRADLGDDPPERPGIEQNSSVDDPRYDNF